MALPFIISVPHCASQIPDTIKSGMALNEIQIRESVDFGTREIFGRIPAQEIIMARWNRLVADPNRAPDRLDAKGVVALTDYHGRPVFRPGREPSGEAILDRVNRYHRPYHAALEQSLHNPKAVALIDGHSLNGTGPADAPDAGQRRKDVILSNNGDTEGRPDPAIGPPSCAPEQIHLFRSAFENQGFSVALNAPYHGGYIVKHYGQRLKPANRFAIQIEINQDLYMAPGGLFPEKPRIERVRRQVINALEEVAARLDAVERSEEAS